MNISRLNFQVFNIVLDIMSNPPTFHISQSSILSHNQRHVESKTTIPVEESYSSGILPHGKPHNYNDEHSIRSCTQHQVKPKLRDAHPSQIQSHTCPTTFNLMEFILVLSGRTWPLSTNNKSGANSYLECQVLCQYSKSSKYAHTRHRKITHTTSFHVQHHHSWCRVWPSYQKTYFQHHMQFNFHIWR